MDAVSFGLKRRETFQRVISVQFKRKHLWWYGVHKCIRYGQLACFGRHYECWKVYKGFRATYAGACVYFREGLVYFSRTIQNHILQLLKQQGFVIEESRCWIDLPAVQIFHLQTTFSASLNKKYLKDNHKLFSSWTPISGKNGTKTPETHNLDAQTSSNCFEKKRRCYTTVNMPPSQLLWDP